jgi:hypothetical protein
MAKKTEAGGFISPANLWGKPLPNLSGSKPAPASKAKEEEERTKRMLADEDDDIDSDVDAELEDEEVVVDDEALAEDDDEAAYEAAAETEENGSDDDDEDEADEEEESYEPEDGDSADAGQAEVDATVAVDSDDPAPVPVTAGAKKKVANMSEKKSGADHIRDEIAKRQAAGESLRGVDIVGALAKRRIEVSPAQVSQLLKKAGAGGAPRGGKKLVTAGDDGKSRVAGKAKKSHAEPPRAAPKARASQTPAALPMEQLKAASAFLAACEGCYDTAGEILSAHKQLGAMMAR